MAKKTPQQIMSELIDLFSNPEKIDQLEDTVTKTFIAGKPCSNWSWSNRFLMTMQGTNDARGHRQWQAVKRNPLDWSKQVTIIAPIVKMVKDEKTDEKKPIITGFKSIGLYAVENTWGKPLEETENYPMPPLAQIAKNWGIDVRYEKIAGEWGHYSPNEKEIVLGTTDQQTFFHELAHVAHEKIDGKLSMDDEKYAMQEAVAQLSSAVLARIYGVKVDKYTFDYIAMYAKGRSADAVGRMCLKVADKVGKVLELILAEKQKIEVVA